MLWLRPIQKIGSSTVCARSEYKNTKSWKTDLKNPTKNINRRWENKRYHFIAFQYGLLRSFTEFVIACPWFYHFFYVVSAVSFDTAHVVWHGEPRKNNYICWTFKIKMAAGNFIFPSSFWNVFWGWNFKISLWNEILKIASLLFRKTQNCLNYNIDSLIR